MISIRPVLSLKLKMSYHCHALTSCRCRGLVKILSAILLLSGEKTASYTGGNSQFIVATQATHLGKAF